MIAEHFILSRNGWAPNNPRLAVIVYRRAAREAGAREAAAAFETLFARNGWPPKWRDGVFDYHHYHSTAHEALGIAAGWARLLLGGQGGREVKVAAGDAALLPAGTAHRQVEASPDFLVVGAYPAGQSFDILTRAPSAQEERAMAALGWPDCDPVSGAQGPLTRLWR
jgi:uncharacterized protein YjlB